MQLKEDMNICMVIHYNNIVVEWFERVIGLSNKNYYYYLSHPATMWLLWPAVASIRDTLCAQQKSS